jgi:GxxExxY protein
MEEIDLNALNRITERIIGAAIEVHRTLGHGLLESTYHAVLSTNSGSKVWRRKKRKPCPWFTKA